MVKTEAEAGAMVCPVRSTSETRTCVGSLCMWWRWVQGPARGFRRAVETPERTGYERPPGTPSSYEFIDDEEDGPGYIQPEEEWTALRRGHCGAVPRG